MFSLGPRESTSPAPRRLWQVGLFAVACAMVTAFVASRVHGQRRVSCSLAEDGRPTAIIVLSRNPTRSARLAAAELQHYVREISGASLRIATEAELDAKAAQGDLVLVGESDLTKSIGLTSQQFQRQEYAIKNVGRWLVLIGRDEEDRGPVDYEADRPWPEARLDPPFGVQFKALGTLYAVDTFLEKTLGVRWYLPGTLGEVVPKNRTLRASGLDVRQKPWTRFRVIGHPSAWDPFDFYAPGRKPQKTVPTRDMLFWWLRLKMGGDPIALGHSMYSYFARFGKSHPEWFAGGTPRAGAHLCYGNSAVVAQHAQDARDYFDGKFPGGKFPVGGNVPGAGDYYSVAPMDSSSGWCATDPLVDLAPEPANDIPGAQFFSGRSSDYVWSFVNAVAKEVGKTHPNKRIAGFAYARYFLPPPGLQIEPNVSVVVTKEVVTYANPRAKQYFDDAVLAWRKQTKEIFVWEYYLNELFSHFTSFPWVAPHQIADDLRFLKGVGIAGEFVETSPWQSRRANMAEDLIPVYVTARLLVDDSRTVDEILDEHYRLFYGPAAPPMKAFFSRLEAAWQTHPDLLPQSAGRRAWEVFATTEKLRGYHEIIDQALHVARTEPYASRVRLMKEAILEPLEARALKLDADRHPRARIACPHVNVPPTIDGKLDDSAWLRAAKTEEFAGTTLERAGESTSARVARDDKNLYLAITANAKGASGGPTRDDSLEIEIDVDRTRVRYYKVVIRSDGSVASSVISPEAAQGSPWASGARVASSRGGQQWHVEVAVPLASLGVASTPAGVWGFNVARIQGSEPSAGAPIRTAWAPSFGVRGAVQDLGLLAMGGLGAERGLVPVVALDFEDEITPRTAVLPVRGVPRNPVAEAKLLHATTGVPWIDADRVPGRQGRAYAFSKADQRYIQLTLPDALSLARDDWTATFWVKSTQASKASLLVSTTTSPAWSVTATIAKGGSTLQFLMEAGAPTSALKGAASSLFDGGWHYLNVSVARGAEAVLSLDGVVIGSTDISAHTAPLKNTITIGGPYDFFDGAIDSLRIYKGALSPQQLTSVRDR